MGTIEILLIILIDFSAFFMGLAFGLAAKKRQKYKRRRKQVLKNNDLLSLLYYTPGEPTEKSVRKI
jgi:Mg2+/Co2+ transporter CorB